MKVVASTVHGIGIRANNWMARVVWAYSRKGPGRWSAT
jgi:hypothetical protein